MNYWTDLSVQFANQRNYLDELFAVYPLAPDVIRQLDETTCQQVEAAFKARDDEQLLQNLLTLDLFRSRIPTSPIFGAIEPLCYATRQPSSGSAAGCMRWGSRRFGPAAASRRRPTGKSGRYFAAGSIRRPWVCRFYPSLHQIR